MLSIQWKQVFLLCVFASVTLAETEDEGRPFDQWEPIDQWKVVFQGKSSYRLSYKKTSGLKVGHRPDKIRPF